MKAGKMIQNSNGKTSLRRSLALSFIWTHDTVLKMWKMSIRRMLFRKKPDHSPTEQDEGL